jgi:hypothetical protein
MQLAKAADSPYQRMGRIVAGLRSRTVRRKGGRIQASVLDAGLV